MARSKLIGLNRKVGDAIGDPETNEVMKNVVGRMSDPKVKYLDLLSILCEQDVCITTLGDQVLWRDRDHLSPMGAEWISPHFIDSIR